MAACGHGRRAVHELHVASAGIASSRLASRLLHLSELIARTPLQLPAAMIVVVGGGTGMVGQPLVRALLTRGDTVVVVGRSTDRIATTFDGEAVAAVEYDGLGGDSGPAALARSADVVVVSPCTRRSPPLLVALTRRGLARLRTSRVRTSARPGAGPLPRWMSSCRVG